MLPGCKISVAVSLVAGQGAFLGGQEDLCANRTVVVGVYNKEGRPVQDLKAKDFHATLRGRTVQVNSSRFHENHRRIVVLLDWSGSMVDQRPRLLIEIIKEIAESSLSDTSIALLVFSHKIIETVDFSPTPKMFVDRLNELETLSLKQPYGRTKLNDAIEEGMSFIGQHQPGDTLLLISDGEDNGSKTPSNKLKRDLVNSGVRLFAFLTVPPLWNRARDSEEKEGAPINAMCEETGGDAVLNNTFDNPAVVKEKVLSLATEMKYVYVLELGLLIQTDKPHQWKLKVERSGRKTESHLHLIYPRRLMPCGSPGNKGND